MTETYWIHVRDRDDFLAGKPAYLLINPAAGMITLGITVEPDEVEVFEDKPDSHIWYIKLKRPKTK